MNIKRLFIATSLLCASISMAVSIKNDAPQHYVVQPGDSLWHLAKQYTDDPWAWRQLWNKNPQVSNPNRIYPGDELSVVNGKIVYKRNFKQSSSSTSKQKGIRTVKLSPQMREVPIELGLPVISNEQLRTKFIDIEIVKSETLKELPYIVAFEDNRLSGYNNIKAFVKGSLIPGKTYNVYDRGVTHKGIKLDDIKKGKKKKNIEIGTELTKVGEVIVENVNDEVSTVYIKNIINRNLSHGQFLIEKSPTSSIGNLYFEPKPAPQKTEAEIVSVPGKLMNVVVGGNVLIDKGLDSGLTPGDLLIAQQADIFKEDPLKPGKKIRIPGQAAGVIMIYKVFDRMSLGIVIESKKAVKKEMMAVTPYSAHLSQ